MKKLKTINNNNFPSDREIETITKKISAPNYPYKNYILSNNANNEEKMKYNLCQNIIEYQQENSLSKAKLTKKLGISKNKITDILFSKIYNLELNELIYFVTEKLKIKIKEFSSDNISLSKFPSHYHSRILYINKQENGRL